MNIHHVFKEVGKIPAAKDLFAEGKTPLWAVAPSGDAAMNLLSQEPLGGVAMLDATAQSLRSFLSPSKCPGL